MNPKRINTQIVKHSLVLSLLAGCMLFAFATIGDGKNKSKTNKPAKSAFVPVKTNGGFTLKSGPYYKGSMLLNNDKNRKDLSSYNSLITYQKGNSTFILPYHNRVPQNKKMQMRSNIEALSFKLNMRH
jgi:hypothetical protein